MKARTIALPFVVVAVVLSGVVARHARGQASADRSLVIHYTFDEQTGETAKDRSPYGNDGKVVKGEWLEELDGRKGVLRFDGDEAVINVPASDSISIEGDLSFEMWVRQNGTPKGTWASFFGDGHYFDLYRVYWYQLVLWYARHNDELKAWESMDVPVDHRIIGERWSHVAVVFEYPRIRFYRDGELVRDAFMPVPQGWGRTAKRIGWKCPMDLDEFRLYRRALTAAEVAAHARGGEVAPPEEIELAVEPDWYARSVTLRVSAKGAKYGGYRAQMTLMRGDYSEAIAPQTAALKEAYSGCGRYVATVAVPLKGLEGNSMDAVARILDPMGKVVRTVFRHAHLEKPEWIETREGYSDEVLPPWTPVVAEAKADGTVELRVWGRRHVFSAVGPFPQEIETSGARILASPIVLNGQAGGKAIAWRNGKVALKESSPTAAVIEQSFDGDAVALRVGARMEYDGYTIYDCDVTAVRDVDLESLLLDIPLAARHATLCLGDRVLPPDPKIPIAEWYSGAVGDKDRSWRFSANIWIGDEERGLCWQAESDEFWRRADEQRSIEILPQGQVTMFRARFVDVPTHLAAGQTLRYEFALVATPIKPLLRDAWDLRIARLEPYGGDLDLPDATVGGKPALVHHADAGVLHLLMLRCDVWPYPLPVHEQYARALARAVNDAHALGLRPYPYIIHERFATMAPEFDLYGLNMVQRPMNQYIPGGNPPGAPRPGPVSPTYGSTSQGTVMHCAKSRALQDADVHALAQLLDEYGVDGVYLDGTGVQKPCRNLDHGCGYRAPDGTIRPTYPVFANREFLKRIYTAVKKRRPEGIVDMHQSFGQNTAGLAYADVLWTGEQWHHLRETGAKHIASELTLDKFRAEFMGRQVGVAAETLAYRLGPQMKVAAISLLHDIPNRPSTPGYDLPGAQAQPVALTPVQKDYFAAMSRLWKVREQFGAKEATKLFYWNNQDYVRVSPEQCYATLLKHPRNGVLAFISNLRTDAATVKVEFNLDALGLAGAEIEAVNALTDEPLRVADGSVTVPLESETWIYIWLRGRR